MWFGESEAKPAPHPLRRVQALINTVDLESGIDRLAEPSSAQPWLEAQGLCPAGHVPTAEELSTLRDVREALRALVVHNGGGPVPTAAQMAPLRRVSDAATARVRLDDEGTFGLEPSDESLPGRLLTLLLVVGDAQRDGTWAQLKACANEECRWAFYDRSRNHGGTWCEMATCGNKLKNRDFRARHSRRSASG